MKTLIVALFLIATPALAATDSFGITQVYQTAGNTWSADWIANRTLSSGTRDGLLVARGDGTITIGSGIATMTGSAPRMYLYNALKQKIWGDVEITFYARRISETQTLSYQGFTAAAKIDHTDDNDICGTRGYYGRMLYDGRMDFEKEINHHATDGYVQFGSVKPWSAVPKNTWIGYKFIAYDNGPNVNFELYRDLTGGTNGGTWIKMTSATDSGQLGAGLTPCAPGIDPTQIMNGKNVSIMIRNDGLGQAQYKWFSVREIATTTQVAPPIPPPATTTDKTAQMKSIIDSLIAIMQGVISSLNLLKTLL